MKNIKRIFDKNTKRKLFESISKVIFSFNYKFKLEHINEIFFAEMYEKNMKKSSSDIILK